VFVGLVLGPGLTGREYNGFESLDQAKAWTSSSPEVMAMAIAPLGEMRKSWATSLLYLWSLFLPFCAPPLLRSFFLPSSAYRDRQPRFAFREEGDPLAVGRPLRRGVVPGCVKGTRLLDAGR